MDKDMDMDFDDMNRDELFFRVEVLLKKLGYHSVTETWKETAVRIEAEAPELAVMLRRAEDRWDEMN
ncbi:MAG: hypothetical protein KKA60_02580 [Proteobacteria bacterium]|nr:hypothetical protein [Pseudomonadota bacterium]